MATPIDTSLLSSFRVIFPFLLVFCIFYAMFLKTKIFGENKSLGAIIAFSLGIMAVLFPVVREVISLMAPWFVFLAFGILFISLMFMILGFNEGDIMGVFRSSRHDYLNVWIIGIGLVIFIGSLVSVISDFGGVGETDFSEGYEGAEGTSGQSQQESDFWNTLVHPTVLGMIFLLLVGAFTVSRLASG
tara:strand:- start:1438 stop:2001 length:564 start_codon:yes stop_codon:yes gene_type:complete